MKKLLFTLTLISSGVMADATVLTQDFKGLIQRNKIGALNEQAYCLSDKGVVDGYQPDKLQRIASVSKLLTTLMASETLNLNQKFQTKVYVTKDKLHIEGGLDPYFEEEKLLLLMRDLNRLGYSKFKQVSFSPDFLFYDVALGEFAAITPAHTRQRLAYYFNSKNRKSITSTWNVVKNFAREEGVILTGNAPFLSATSVIVSNLNPVLVDRPEVFVHTSRPLHSILKSMNVMSKNMVAENIYNMISKRKTFETLMKEKGVDITTFKIVNGSGLPIVTRKSRVDNLASCRMILKSISLLLSSVRRQNFELSDIVAVNGGKDLGSFRNRFTNYPETHEAVLSKTGTLKHTSSLAGILLSSAEVPFAILNHTVSMAAARDFQDEFVSLMFDHVGPPTPLVYEKLSIFPWGEEDFLELMH